MNNRIIPNAAVVLGILSIFIAPVSFLVLMLYSSSLLLLLPVMGLACGILAVSISKEPLHLYKENLASYSKADTNRLRAGKICGIIGIVLEGALLLLYMAAAVMVAAGIVH